MKIRLGQGNEDEARDDEVRWQLVILMDRHQGLWGRHLHGDVDGLSGVRGVRAGANGSFSKNRQSTEIAGALEGGNEIE
jgi:hypothetical protein